MAPAELASELRELSVSVGVRAAVPTPPESGTPMAAVGSATLEDAAGLAGEQAADANSAAEASTIFR